MCAGTCRPQSPFSHASIIGINSAPKSSGFAAVRKVSHRREEIGSIMDNAACIEWGNNVIGGRERAKHIDIRKHFAHEVIQNGEMRLIKVATKHQLADILTKGLHLPQVTACVDGLLGRTLVSST